MFCPNCGSQLSDDGNFCPNCGTKMMAAPQAQPVQVPPVPVQSVAPAQPEAPAVQPVKKSKMGLIIGLSAGITVLVGLLLALLLFFLLNGGSKEPTVTYRGMTFTYGMEVDTDALERKFSELRYMGSRENVVMLDGLGLVIREDAATGKTVLVGMMVNAKGDAKMNGVRVGSSERSFRSAFPLAEHPVMMNGVVNDTSYTFYMYEGNVYTSEEYEEKLNECLRNEDQETYKDLRTSALMLSAMVRDGKVVNISFGDVMALLNMQ